MTLRRRFWASWWALLTAMAVIACHPGESSQSGKPDVPRGYLSRLEVQVDGKVLGFGPFVGYYFSPEDPSDLRRLRFVCFNERQFYTLDLPETALLFRGEAQLTTLPGNGAEIPSRDRITPVFFKDAPESWLGTRPEPVAEWRHFHSCHDARGAVLTGYWLRHSGVAEFTYDMGGRVGPKSPLYHRVTIGPDIHFARIVEFDRGS